MKSLNKKHLDLALLTLVYSVLWAPVVLVIIYSFSNNKFGLSWEGFTLKWYGALVNNAEITSAIMRSLFITSITVVVATIVGTSVAYGLYKYKFRGKDFLRTGILLPIIMPSIVTGGALLVLFTKVIPIPLGYPSIIIAHITFCVPIVIFVVLGRMARIDWALEEASADLGANTLTTWRKITVPLLLPAVLASMMIVFPWSFNDFTITYFVTGLGVTTLPLYIFSQMVHGSQGVMLNVIATILVMLPIFILLLRNFSQRKEVT
ncbi:MAG: ABC transporter permease subunit [Clostridia bacterium]|nr:ABC transporter permease subunit [Clostridia bacterium]